MADEPEKKIIPEEHKKAFKTLVDEFEKEDDFIYKEQLKILRKNEEYWHGIQYLFWNEDIGDWASPANSTLQELEAQGTDSPLYDYVINIYKAHGESIIGAVTARLPFVHHPPDDADNVEDQMTSKEFSKIAELVQKRNRAKLLFIRAWYLLYTGGVVAGYNYSKSDAKFGTVKVPHVEEKNIKAPDTYFCPRCKQQMISGDPQNCDSCGSAVAPVVKEGETIKTPVTTGVDEVPKNREFFDFYSLLHVKIPFYARQQEDCLYLFHYLEQHYALLRELYPELVDEIGPGTPETHTYGRWARTPTTFLTAYRGEDLTSLLTVRRCWFRPAAFNRLYVPNNDESKKLVKELKEKYPKGALAVFIGDIVAEIRDEDMDNVWTLTSPGVSSYIHSDPLGQPIMPVQDMINTTVNLTVETIESGIPEGFADPQVVDFDTYPQHESRPNVLYPAKEGLGQRSLAEGFYTLPKSTLSREVPVFREKLDKDAQFLVGSQPPIYGGPGTGNSRTFSEYNMSRAQALQRLMNPWNVMTDMWARVIDKAVRRTALRMLEDEHFTKKEKGRYKTTWIRKAALKGKVGDVEPEAAEDLPISAGQKRDLLERLMTLNNENINAALYHPENTKLLVEALSFPDFFIPGETQRLKQYVEIEKLLKEEPRKGEMSELSPSVGIDLKVDDDAIHLQVIKDFLVSPEGMDQREINPGGYTNCILHLDLHEHALTVKTKGTHEGTMQGETPATSALSTST